MGSIVIHIGFHKAASTYLQQRVFSRIQANYVFLAGYKRRILDMVQSDREFDERALKEWVDGEIRRKKTAHDLTVLSHEELSGHPHGYKSVDPFVVAANLKQAYPNAKILIIIRNQFDYLLSLYKYRVAIKGEESRSLEKFLNEEGGLGLFDKLEYDRIVKRYQSLFGKENVLVLPVELLRSDPEAFNAGIFAFLNVPPVSVDGLSPVNESTNLLLAMRLWRPINFAFDSFLDILRSLHIEFDEEYPYMGLRYKFYALKRGTTYRLNRLFRASRKVTIEGYSKYDELFARCAASNARLQRLIRFNLEEYGYPAAKAMDGRADTQTDREAAALNEQSDSSHNYDSVAPAKPGGEDADTST